VVKLTLSAWALLIVGLALGTAWAVALLRSSPAGELVFEPSVLSAARMLVIVIASAVPIIALVATTTVSIADRR
jgi:hypothetical protein